MNKVVFHNPQINQWLLWAKLPVAIGIILLATSWWFRLDLAWLNDAMEILIYLLMLLIIVWNYKIKVFWKYTDQNTFVDFYSNGLGYQKIVVTSGEFSGVKEYLSYKPKEFTFEPSMKLQFSRINNEIGGFGLHFVKNGEILLPDHVVSTDAT